MRTRALLFVMALALALRLPGLFWGLPGPTHLFSYHPDEFHSLRGALSFAQGDLNPHFLNYGCLYLYAVAGTCAAAHPSLMAAVAQTPAALPRALRTWTADARLVSLVAGLATVAAVALAAQALGGHGLWAALALALMPLHSLHCRYATVDVTLALFVALAVWATARGQARPALYVWAGVFAGLAASTKYTGAVVLAAPLVALAVDGGLPAGRRAGLAAACAGAALLAFAVTSPYVLLAWQEAGRDVLFEMRHMRVGESPAREAEPWGPWFHLKWLTLGTGGLALAGLIGMAMAAAAGDRERRWLPVAVLAAILVVMISATGVRYARYELPLLPLAALGVGWLGALGRRGATAVLTALMALAAVHCVTICVQLTRPDSRDLALRELVQRSEADQSVGMPWQPWFQGPPVDYCNGGEALRRNPLWAGFSRELRQLVVTGYDAGALGDGGPDWFSLGEVEDRDFRRAGQATPFWQALEAHYEVVAEWHQGSLAGLAPRALNPPQDWLYPVMPLKLMRQRSGLSG